MTPVADTELWQEAKAKVDRFVARFGNASYKDLARHAALPLVLTPELVNYLRNEFLRGEAVPWEAEVDLLLSDLCSQVGYELYAMETQVRAYLLEEIKESPFWQQRMREVAQVLFGYVNFLSRLNPEKRQQELEAQRLAAMVYMGDEACQQAVQALAEWLKQVSDVAESGAGSERGIRAELARLSRITQELAPQLQETPALVEYARLVQRVLRNPEAVDPGALRQVYQVGDVSLTVSPRVLPTHQDRLDEVVEVAGFPPLAMLNFETGQLVEQGSGLPPLQTQTVESVTLFFADQPASAKSQTEVVVPMTGGVKIGGQMTGQRIPELQPFLFEIATIDRDPSARNGWKINRRQGEAQRYEEPLGDDLVLEIVAIPSGGFRMGSPEDEPGRQASEGPQHDVWVQRFYMGRYPVTQAQWRFVAALPQINQELNLNPSRFEGDTRPVEQVSWYHAVEFCNRLSRFTQREYRLPTETEWEYSCRARTMTPFHFGATMSSVLANYAASESYSSGPKGEYRAKTTFIDHFGVANAFGLCDMHGNVWEWCEDHWHDSYKNAPVGGSAWLSKNEKAARVHRGGSWSSLPRVCRSASRDFNTPGRRDDNIGFRVVCSALGTL